MGLLQSLLYFRKKTIPVRIEHANHRIIIDRMENSIKGRQMGDNLR